MSASLPDLGESALRAIVRQAFELLMVVDEAHVVRWANPAFEGALGYAPESFVGTDVFPLVHLDDIQGLVETICRLGRTPGATGSVDFRMRASSGDWHWMETSATNLLDEPAVGGFVVSLRDVTDERASDAALRASEKRYRDLFEHALDGVFTAGIDGTLTSVNASAEKLTGYNRAELVGSSFYDLIAPEKREAAAEALARRLAGGADEPVELELVQKDGERIFVEVVGRIVEGEGGPPTLEGIARDTTERHVLTERLVQQALHDSLTGLPNRKLLLDRLTRALARDRRSRTGLAVMVLDVDGFKLINDTLGHAAGDDLLVQLAGRLQATMREAETVGRFGGDEFALIAEGTRSDRDVTALADRIVAVFEEPFRIGGTARRLTGSLGIAIAEDGSDAIGLLRDADTAMYRIKGTGKSGFDVCDAALRAQVVRKYRLGKALEDALAAGELEVHYQPIVSLFDGRVQAVEALVRWRHHEWGWVRPSEFIPLAEENGLVVPLGRFVQGEALRAIAGWRARYPAALPGGVGVNVSPRELSDPRFAGQLTETLREHSLAGPDVALELSERVFVDGDDPSVHQNLRDLTEGGVRLVLDDFGTGFSALSALQRFRITALKIDRLFTRSIRKPADDAPIARAIVNLAKTLGMHVTAVGVEQQVQLDYLRGLGCDFAQGLLTGPLRSADGISTLLAAEPLLASA